MTASKRATDAGVAEVEQKTEKEQAQGFIGQKVDPRPNEEYSLESGPDSPPHAADIQSRHEQVHAEVSA